MYNGKGNFDKSLDLAKTLDDPQLIMYGLVKQIESLKNNPDLSGEERSKIKTYEQQLDEYKRNMAIHQVIKICRTQRKRVST